jgi:hypothetical protein
MRVRDDRALDRSPRIDVEIARWAVKAFGTRNDEVSHDACAFSVSPSLFDIRKRCARGKSRGYERWASFVARNAGINVAPPRISPRSL